MVPDSPPMPPHLTLAQIKDFSQHAVNWKYANWIIAVFLGIASIMVGIGQYGISIIFVVASATWTSILWWRSKPSKKKERGNGKRKITYRPYKPFQIGGVVAIVVVYGIPIYFLNAQRIRKSDEENKPAFVQILVPLNGPLLRFSGHPP